MARRVILFVITNLLVITTLSILMSVFGVGNYLTPYGIDYTSLMVVCLVWGFMGSLISLAMSRIMAKWMMKVKIVDPISPGEHEWLLVTTHRLARSAGLPKMPEVGIFQSSDVNAFATGPTKSRALTAVSTGLMQTMDKDATEGVIAHEIAHIASGDMVTMTLIQGVINAFIMFFARIIAYAVSQAMKDSKLRGVIHFVTVMVLQFALGFLGMLVAGWFSRKREFKADADSAKLAGRDKMIAALKVLQGIQGKVPLEAKPNEAMAALQISSNGKKSNFAKLMSTHPPLSDRISALEKHA